jgi:hypothetical protein
MTTKDYEDRFDDAHEAFGRNPCVKTAEALDRAKAALWHARSRPEVR